MKPERLTMIALWVIGFLIGVLLIIGCMMVTHHPMPPLGLIDTHTLVTVEAQKIAKEYKTGIVPPERLQRIATRLKKMIDRFANKNKVIIFAKGAVWGGELPDYTEHFLQTLGEQENPDVP